MFLSDVTWVLKLKDENHKLIKLIFFSIDKSSIDLNLSFGSMIFVFLLVCDKHSEIPNNSPWDPPPFSVCRLLVDLFYFTFGFVEKLTRIGIRLELTPFSMKDWIPSLCDKRSKAWDQSNMVTMTANAFHWLFWSKAVRIL